MADQNLANYEHGKLFQLRAHLRNSVYTPNEKMNHLTFLARKAFHDVVVKDWTKSKVKRKAKKCDFRKL